MKMPLTQTLVIEKLNIDVKPRFAPNGKVEYVPNEGRQAYIVFDSDRNAPVGFGVKVGATKKTYILQRRVSSDASRASDDAPPPVLKTKIGNVSDFTSINAARELAKTMAQVMLTTKRNPREVAREQSAADLTLGECFTRYLKHLTGREKPAKQNTLDALDKAKKKLASWDNLRVTDLRSDAIVRRFDEIAAKTQTTAEQTFRWASVAVKLAIAREELDARTQGRVSTLAFNPFIVLSIERKFRSKARLEEIYETKKIRNPLSPKNTLGVFLNALLGRRAENRTGCDYLLLTVLWGTRKSEAAGLVWRDYLTEEEALTTPWVDLKKRRVFFPDTKNRKNHWLPLGDGAFEILRLRRDLQELQFVELPENSPVRKDPFKWRFVFPARSKFSKTGHYSDAKSLLGYICKDANILRADGKPRLTMHDLRRTLGGIAEESTSYAVVKRLLNHRDVNDVTQGYTAVDDERLSEVEQKIELYILSTAPRLYNLLLAGKRDPLPEPTFPAMGAETQNDFQTVNA